MSRFPFPSYPSGWFALGFSSDFVAGEVVIRQLFGQELVVYRTDSGVLHVAEPHCPHLGAHLGHGGRVIGERLRCPFHGWCFDASGQCVEVPGAERVPPRATLRKWPLREANGIAFVHHDAAGAAPSWDVPTLPVEEWTPDRTVVWTLRTHVQEISENVVDAAHLPPLHGVERAAIVRGPIEDGPMLNVALELAADGAIVGMPGMINDVLLDVTLHGLGHMVVQTHVRNVGIRARQRIYCTPVDDERTEVRGVVNLMLMDDPVVTAQVAELFYQAYVIDFAQDFPVWEHKAYRDKPILSSADGPFMAYRKWTRQFYPAAAAQGAPAHG